MAQYARKRVLVVPSRDEKSTCGTSLGVESQGTQQEGTQQEFLLYL